MLKTNFEDSFINLTGYRNVGKNPVPQQYVLSLILMHACIYGAIIFYQTNQQGNSRSWMQLKSNSHKLIQYIQLSTNSLFCSISRIKDLDYGWEYGSRIKDESGECFTMGISADGE